MALESPVLALLTLFAFLFVLPFPLKQFSLALSSFACALPI
jgi:hypothetical protein